MTRKLANALFAVALLNAPGTAQHLVTASDAIDISPNDRVPVTTRPENWNQEPLQDKKQALSSQRLDYYWNSISVGGSAQLLTLFCKACGVSKNNEQDLPLLSVLRDTLGDQTEENDRVTDVWLLTYARPRVRQRILSAVPFSTGAQAKGRDR